MQTCFVIQPFDSDKFDNRYDDIFSGAIAEAGLTPYRVDRDPSADIPIEKIEREIKNAEACFADITTDNPNVWFELGYAVARCKPVCLVCSKERVTKFPFDIQHRHIIIYDVGAPRDFVKLKESITRRLIAILSSGREMRSIASLEPATLTEGMAPHELAGLAAIVRCTDEGGITLRCFREQMACAGFSELGASLAIRSLLAKGLAWKSESFDDNEPYSTYLPTDNGWSLLLRHQDILNLRSLEEDESPSPPWPTDINL